MTESVRLYLFRYERTTTEQVEILAENEVEALDLLSRAADKWYVADVEDPELVHCEPYSTGDWPDDTYGWFKVNE